MNWSKIKNIVIGILILINLFLLADIALTKYMSTSLPKETSEHFVSVLKKNNISVSENAVPRYYETRTTITAKFHTIDTLTDLFIGEKVRYVSDGHNVIAALNDKRLEVTGDKFRYSTLKDGVEKNSDDIMKAAKKLGILPDDAVYDDEEGRIKVAPDGVEIEGIYLDVTLSADGEICLAEGIWPELVKTGKTEKVSVISAVNTICDVLEDGSVIDRIEKTYLFETVNKQPGVVNAWRVYADGKSYVVK